MTKKSEFYTLKGYDLKDKKLMTYAMEDYLEMIYRIFCQQKSIHVKEIAKELNVSIPSASKMMRKLKSKKLITFEKYGEIRLLEKGKKTGTFLLWRHQVLTEFFRALNGKHFTLKQVERIEHFIDFETLKNLERLTKTLLKKNKNNLPK